MYKINLDVLPIRYWNIKTIIEKGLIERTGATKKGEWIVKSERENTYREK